MIAGATADVAVQIFADCRFIRVGILFHQVDGAGYEFAAQKILQLDAINPQVAARLANPFVHWRKLDSGQGQLMKTQVENMLVEKGMSNDLNELLTTSLRE